MWYVKTSQYNSIIIVSSVPQYWNYYKDLLRKRTDFAWHIHHVHVKKKEAALHVYNTNNKWVCFLIGNMHKSVIRDKDDLPVSYRSNRDNLYNQLYDSLSIWLLTLCHVSCSRPIHEVSPFLLLVGHWTRSVSGCDNILRK